jgi:hypothetical protein
MSIPRKPGRPSKFTPERQAKILDGLRAGMTRRASAGFAGVAENTFQGWLAQPTKADFKEEVEEAESFAEARHTGSIAKAAFGEEVTRTKTTTRAEGTVTQTIETRWESDWRAALEWLRRRRRKEWGNDETQETPARQFVVVVPEECDTPELWEQKHKPTGNGYGK